MASQELDSISVKGFRSISSIEKLQLSSINVVIGPNGAGKSNFIGVFSFLNAIREGRLQDYVTKAGGAEKILYFGSKITKKIDFHLSFSNEVNQYSLSLAPTENDNLFPSEERVYFWDKARYPTGPYIQALQRKGNEAAISEQTQKGTAFWVRQHLGSWRVYHFHDTSTSSPMKKTADIGDNRYLRPDGSNLASFLYYLREKHETSYSLIVRTVQRVTPFFDNFLLEPLKLNPEKIRLEWRHKNSDQYFDASSLSDGTLRFIGLATLFLQPHTYRPSVILVDEPELGLHPYAITMLASLVKAASEKTQVILSTQSPMLLDQFQPEDVLVADRKDDSTHFTRLDPDKLASWLEDYSLGQLWEKNELGGRP
ncbi:MAG: AAA family ATPase [Pyrinomonadaceae bacterium]